MKKTGSTAAARVSLATFLALAGACAPRSARHAVASSQAEVFDPRDAQLSVETAGGGRFDLAAQRGKAVIVAVLSANDLAGHALARNLEHVAAAHPDDLAVLLLAADDYDSAAVRTAMEVFADVAGLHHAAIAALPDELRTGTSVFGDVSSGSAVFLVNRAGRVARRLEGAATVEALETLVAPALPRR